MLVTMLSDKAMNSQVRTNQMHKGRMQPTFQNSTTGKHVWLWTRSRDSGNPREVGHA